MKRITIVTTVLACALIGGAVFLVLRDVRARVVVSEPTQEPVSRPLPESEQLSQRPVPATMEKRAISRKSKRLPPPVVEESIAAASEKRPLFLSPLFQEESRKATVDTRARNDAALGILEKRGEYRADEIESIREALVRHRIEIDRIWKEPVKSMGDHEARALAAGRLGKQHQEREAQILGSKERASEFRVMLGRLWNEIGWFGIEKTEARYAPGLPYPDYPPPPPPGFKMVTSTVEDR